MDLLNAELSTIGISNYEGMVFSWDDKRGAFEWIQQLPTERSTLVLIGHSFGGHSTLQLAGDILKNVGVNVDLTVQVDPVSNSGSRTRNNRLPTNVEVGINYYQTGTGIQGEDMVQGAAYFNVEELFNDTSITHTSIDNDPRLHALIGQNILDILVPEPSTLVLGAFGAAGLIAGRRHRKM